MFSAGITSSSLGAEPALICGDHSQQPCNRAIKVGNLVPERLLTVQHICTIMVVAPIFTPNVVKRSQICTSNLPAVPTKILEETQRTQHD